ncbi:hypothetical protein vseg_007256 [Gypsophila vaccaria]
MDQNLPIVTKKLLSMMRVVFYILRKTINKKKLLLDLNLLIKRGKFVAGKTLTNLLFHHHQTRHVSATLFEDEYEFSCTNTPLYRHYFTNITKSKNNDHLDKITSVDQMWEMLAERSNRDKLELNGGRRSPTVSRKLRITDSPYPVDNEGGDLRVDEAADEFIKRFYDQLRQQTC